MEKHLKLARIVIVVLIPMLLGLTWNTYRLEKMVDKLSAECQAVVNSNEGVNRAVESKLHP